VTLLAEKTHPPQTSVWRFISTPPMTGAENMSFDVNTSQQMVLQGLTPLLRFFRWSQPTVSYGRHQSFDKIQALVPVDWDTIQRPTGGGLVFHNDDLCFSLCWREGQSPLPLRLRGIYAWIHTFVVEALQPILSTRLANCRDCAPEKVPFATRQCFTEPVAFDVLHQGHKVVGGALCRQKNVFLYQGSIQGLPTANLEQLLKTRFIQIFPLLK
jgi:lipoate-protein ligase A